MMLYSMIAIPGFNYRIAAALIGSAALVPIGLGLAADRDVSQVVHVSDARVGTSNDLTRFVLDLSGPASFSTRILNRPPRLVIDMPNVNFKLLAEGGAGAGLVREYRYGLIGPKKSRVVIDLQAAARVARKFIFRHESGIYRLVVDLATDGAGTAQGSRSEKAGQDTPPAQSKPPAVAQQPQRAPARARPQAPVIVIDPGHGGPDPGTISARKRREKWIVLEFAKRLKAELNFRGIANVALTRNADVFVPLAGRVEFARNLGASLFLSIHADAIDKSRAAKTSGATLYTLSKRGTDAEARALASRENASDIVAGFDAWDTEPDVSAILISLIQNQTNKGSIDFSGRLLAHLHGRIRLNRRPQRKANFKVLRTQGIPAVLLELGYLSNRADEARLVSGRWQTRASRAVACAIVEHLKGAKALQADCAG